MKMDPSGSDMSFAKLNETTCELCNGVGVAKDCWVLLSSFKLLCGWLLSLYRRVGFFVLASCVSYAAYVTCLSLGLRRGQVSLGCSGWVG